MRSAAVLFIIQAVNYGLITFNYRAIAAASAANAITSDVLFASLSYFVIRKIAKDEQSLVAWLGYVAGSGLGTWLGILASTWWMGK